MDYFFQDFQSTDKQIELSVDESKHIYKVLRKRDGDAIGLLNGKGLEGRGEILSYSGKQCTVRIDEIIKHENTFSKNLTIAIAPTKNMDRFEFFLEKATEIGVGKIIPLLCSNSERKIIKMDRLEKQVVAAMKQSKRYHLPVLSELLSFQDFLKMDASEAKFIAHCEDENSKRSFAELLDSTKSTTILIGPEGDFSINEIKLALEKGYLPVNLGNSRLRTETAGIYSSVCFNI